MNRTLPRGLVATAVLALVAAAHAPTAAASDGLTEHTDSGPRDRTATGSAEMAAAMQRDLNLSPAEIEDRLEREAVAADLVEAIEKVVDDAYGGAWLDEQQRLVVAVTDRGSAQDVRMLGARPEIVEYTAEELDSTVTRLNRAERPSPDEIAGWYVDVETNTVVVEALEGSEDAAQDFIETSGVDADAVRIESTTEAPQLYYDVRGGDAYYPGSSRCSVGFSVNGGFVTAGHCGGVNTTTRGYNQVTQGVVRGSNFPGRDYGWVQVNSNWTPTPLVNRYSGSQTVTVAGSQEAAINASVCRSGSTTGWRCGTITHKNQTVNYVQGQVTGLTRTTACAEPGDSGGSWLAGQQAQGVTSGGSGNCSTGGVTYFQPIWPILSAYGLTLVTSGGGGGTPPPPPPSCSGYQYNYSGSLSGTGSFQYQPNGSYFSWPRAGTHRGCLSGPSGSDFDLYLQRHYSGYGWATVASSTSTTSQESLTYNGAAGNYRYVVYSYRGSGSYTMGISVP